MITLIEYSRLYGTRFLERSVALGAPCRYHACAAGNGRRGFAVEGPRGPAAPFRDEPRREHTVKTQLTRLVFGAWLVGAPLVLLGCSDTGTKPADTATTPPPAPAGGAPADATKPAGDAAK
jgi:hypothetical protein